MLVPAAAIAFMRAARRVDRIEVICIIDVYVNRIDANNRPILLMQLFNLPEILESVRVYLVVEFVPKREARKL